MSTKRWFLRITALSIFIGLCLGPSYPSVNAQDIPTDQPTNTAEVQATETPTVEPLPTGTAAPANNASTTDTTPLLSWRGVVYATGYEVQISKNSGFIAIVQQPVVTGVSEYTAEPLVFSGTGTYYYWRVRSINTYGQKGSWSAYLNFKVVPLR